MQHLILFLCECVYVCLMWYCVSTAFVVSTISLNEPPMFKVPEAPKKPIPEAKIPPAKGIIPAENVKCLSFCVLCTWFVMSMCTLNCCTKVS